MVEQANTEASGFPESQPSVVRVGLTAGILGATVVAALFFVTDLVRGRPFLVPAGLGHALLHTIGLAGAEGMAAHVIAYSVFHYVAFALVGIFAAAIAHRAEQHSGVLVGAFLLFIVFETGFLALSSALALTSVLGSEAWALVTVGNLLAAVVMGWSISASHPTLWRRWNLAMSGRDDVLPDEGLDAGSAAEVPASADGSGAADIGRR